MKGGTGYWDTDREAKEAFLKTAWNGGHSAGEIVAALKKRFGGNPTRNAVVGKVHRMGLPMHQATNKWRGIPSGRARS